MLNQVYNAGLWTLFETCCRYKFAVCNTGEGVNDHPEDSVVAYLFVPETRCIPKHLMVQSAFHLISKQCGLSPLVQDAGAGVFPKEKRVTSWLLKGIPPEKILDELWLYSLFKTLGCRFLSLTHMQGFVGLKSDQVGANS